MEFNKLKVHHLKPNSTGESLPGVSYCGLQAKEKLSVKGITQMLLAKEIRSL